MPHPAARRGGGVGGRPLDPAGTKKEKKKRKKQLICINDRPWRQRQKGGMHDFAAKPASLCPHCGKPMRLGRIVPRLGGLPELRTYECRACGISFTEERRSEDEVSYFPAEAL